MYGWPSTAGGRGVGRRPERALHDVRVYRADRRTAFVISQIALLPGRVWDRVAVVVVDVGVDQIDVGLVHDPVQVDVPGVGVPADDVAVDDVDAVEQARLEQAGVADAPARRWRCS